MLNLDIVLDYFNSACKTTASRKSSAPCTAAAVCEFYTDRLQVEAGTAGYWVTDEFLFCGKILLKNGTDAVFVGPATEHPLPPETIVRIEHSLGLGRKNSQELQETLRKLPLTTFSSFLQDLSFLNYILNEDDSLRPYNASSAAGATTPMAADTEPVFHNTADFEDSILQCVEFGETEKLKSLLADAQINRRHMGKVSSTTLQSLKHVFITSTTLACRSAVKGGLDYDRAMGLSDLYLQRSEKIANYDEFSVLFQEMLTDLTVRTRELQLHSGCSNLIRGTVRSINAGLNRKITVSQLAEEHRVSSSYLSHRFKEETGMTLTDYIAAQKIREARRLMKNTDLTLAQIAYQLAFSSQSYFHAVFKKVTGITPAQFPRK